MSPFPTYNMVWTMCTSQAAIDMAGTNANSTLIAYGGTNKTLLDNWSTSAEGSIEVATGKTYISNWASLPAGVSGALSDICAAKIAMKIIGYDTTGYLSREADTLLNINSDIIQKGLKDLKDYTQIKLKSPI